MLVKLGVDISRLNREIRRALVTVERQFNLYSWEAVITSTYDGGHSPGSLHYSNDAFDVRLPDHSQALVLGRIVRELKKDFDVVQELDHYHIEYDPKRKQPTPRGTV